MQIVSSLSSFRTIEQYLGLGQPVPSGWLPLTQVPMLICVGLTSVGKSSAVNALADFGLDYTLLPDRRNLVSQLIIAQMQLEDNEPVRELNRFERYPYIRRYNDRYRGGLATGLAQTYIDPRQVRPHLVLNGLRGESEITFAVEAFPLASFVFFDAPDIVRLKRMFQRHDPHDVITAPASETQTEAQALTSFAALSVPEAATAFSSAEEDELLDLARRGIVTVSELRDKLRIFVEEHRTYDPVATRRVLAQRAAHRTLFVDTTTQRPADIAAGMVSILNVE